MLGAKSLDTIESLADQYDCFVFDVYGVIYDGVSLLNRTIEFIHHLRKLNKTIAFLSNSQRLPSAVIEKLKMHGFTLEPNEKLFTSGGYFREFLSSGLHSKDLFYHLGSPKNVESVDIALTNDLVKASHILITFMTSDEDQMDSCDELLKQAVGHGCQAVCINPDITAPYGNQILYTPGYFAKKYEEFGGKVIYFGKPHKGIYDFFIDKFLNESGIPKHRTIAIGDSISTDIKGARDFGIDSLLVFSPERKLQSSFNHQDQITPTYSFQI